MKIADLEFRTDIEATASYYGQIKLTLKKGTVYIGDKMLTDEEFEASEKKLDILKNLKELIEEHNEQVKKIEEAKTKITESVILREAENVSGEWADLKDLRTKKANELKELTVKKLEELNKELTEKGMWDWVDICRVEFFDYEKEDGFGDEQARLIWIDGKYEIRYSEKNRAGNWIEKDNLDNVKVDIENLKKTQVRRIAKALPSRLKELTEAYREEIKMLDSLIDGLEQK